MAGIAIVFGFCWPLAIIILIVYLPVWMHMSEKAERKRRAELMISHAESNERFMEHPAANREHCEKWAAYYRQCAQDILDGKE